MRAEAYHGTGVPLRVLVVLAANGGNVVTTMLLDNRFVQVYGIVAEGFQPDVVLPEHHVFFNAIGDADRSPDALLKSAEIASSWASRCFWISSASSKTASAYTLSTGD